MTARTLRITCLFVFLLDIASNVAHASDLSGEAEYQQGLVSAEQLSGAKDKESTIYTIEYLEQFKNVPDAQKPLSDKALLPLLKAGIYGGPETEQVKKLQAQLRKKQRKSRQKIGEL